MIAIVVSRADHASEHIGEQLLDVADWTPCLDDERPDADGGGRYYRLGGFEYRTFDALHLELDSVADAFGGADESPSFVVFVSRHAGDTGPLLSAHFTGNFGPAEYGGRDGELARACPNAQKAVVRALDEHAPDGYDVAIECTHHGPSAVGAPSMFVELGSGPDEWDDAEGARAVAQAVLSLDGVPADRREPTADADTAETGDRTRHVVGFGGGHYAPRFGRIVTDTDWAVGHVGADWPLEAMGHPEPNRAVVEAAFEASAADLAVVDGDYPRLEAVVDELGYRVVPETYLRVTDGVSRELVDALEAALSTVAEGLRFGDDARERSRDDYVFRSLPTALLEAAMAVDGDATREAVEAHTVAFETTESGTRPAGAAALASQSAYDALVDGLCAVLDPAYEEVRREADAVVVRERTFDPGAARECGVPEGPAFGRLANGEAVDVDGDVVEPASVHRERTERFPV